jgi:hypothetical protein
MGRSSFPHLLREGFPVARSYDSQGHRQPYAAIDRMAALVLGTVCLASPWCNLNRSPKPHTNKHAACEMKVLDSLLPPSTPEWPTLGGSS